MAQLEARNLHTSYGLSRVLFGVSFEVEQGSCIALIGRNGVGKTTTMRSLIAHRPGFVAPTLAARKAATLDQLSGGRIALHIISGGSDVEQERDGDFLDHDGRYRRTGEYMDILRRVWTAGEPFDYEGEFYRLKGANSQVRCFQAPHVPLFFGGASDIALEVGSRHADVFALWGEPRAAIRQRVADIRRRAGEWGRDIAFSLSVRPILGATEEAAWQRAERILDRVRESTRGSITPGQPARLQSVGSRRLLDFAAQGDLHDERLWMPVATASGAAGSTTCLVGAPRQVAESLLAYYDLGCTTFIIRGFDPLNDAREYGRELIPLLREMVAGRPSAV